MDANRREFIKSAVCAAAIPGLFAGRSSASGRTAGEKGGDAARQSIVTPEENAMLDVWQSETDLATCDLYVKYLKDGNTRGLKSLERLERAFEKVLREAKTTVVEEGRLAVWSVYNMGFIVKTKETMFSIDLVHRRAVEFAPMLDFALITHNHNDHWMGGFYKAMNGARKTVISNFLDNYGATHPRKGGSDGSVGGGYVRGEKTFRIKDVDIRTSLIDHNDYLIDFTTAFEIRIGDFILYHTGDSGKGTEPKLETKWGRPDLWLFFPGCGVDVAKAVRKVAPKRVVFGHLWELGHKTGRLMAPHVRKALDEARPLCPETSFALWGDRII